MARPRIHPTILADKGYPLALVGGRTVNLCFGFEALMLVEERFGSIAGAVDVINSLDEGGEGPPSVDIFTTVVRLLACGLGHESGQDETGKDNGVPLSNAEELGYWLDPSHLEEYATAIGAAFIKAFPPAPADTKGGEGDEDPSRGRSGTGSDESTSDSQKTSGGG
jgi:hypothetical protein